jgi:hypothetical protein
MTHPRRLEDERRQQARYDFQLEAVCRLANAGAASRAIQVKICDLSMRGLGLLSGQRFEPGALLSLDLSDSPRSRAGTLMVRVANVRSASASLWIHGCAFVSHLSGNDMQAAFPVKLSRAPGTERRALLRYRLNLPASGRSINAPVRTTWSGMTQDISAGGISFVAGSKLDAGTLLTLKLEGATPDESRTLLARVVHARRGENDDLVYGCSFPTRLKHDELLALLRVSWQQSDTGRTNSRLESLKLTLADQIERNAVASARATIEEILRLAPNDVDALAAQTFLEPPRSAAVPAVPAEPPPPEPRAPIIEAKRLNGHRSAINAIAISADGRYLMSGSGYDDPLARDEDRSVRFWDLAHDFELHAYHGHKAPVTAVGVARRSSRAVSASHDSNILLWDFERRTILRQFEPHGRGTNCLAFSAQGRWALSGCDDAVLRLWDADLGRCMRHFRGHNGPISGVALFSDERLVVTASKDQTVRIWTVEPQPRCTVLQGHKKAVLCVAVSHDRKLIASGDADSLIRLWDVASRQEVRCLEGHENMVNSVAFSSDGHFLVSASADNSVRLWDVRSGKELQTFMGNTRTVKCAIFTPDDKHVMAGGVDQTIRTWKVPGG